MTNVVRQQLRMPARTIHLIQTPSKNSAIMLAMNHCPPREASVEGIRPELRLGPIDYVQAIHLLSSTERMRASAFAERGFIEHLKGIAWLGIWGFCQDHIDRCI